MADKFVGLDGYLKGWVAVWLCDGHQDINYLPNIDALLAGDFKIAMVDMPIGLPHTGERDCDLEARIKLKPNQSRVFLGARRCYLDCQTQPEASAKAKASDGKGISTQLFGITKKLKELDAAISPQRQKYIMECHPELVFWRLNKEKPVPKKKSREGVELRRRLLRDQGFDRLEEFLEGRKGTGAKIDDVLDACACAIAARDQRFTPALGGKPDHTGLRMEIHY